MRVPPLPVGGLFPLGCLAPVVVLLVLRLQVLVPVQIFLRAPLMCLMVPALILSGDDRGGCKQRDSQHERGKISQHIPSWNSAPIAVMTARLQTLVRQSNIAYPCANQAPA